MSVLKLAGFELRRMTRGKLPAAALVVLTVIPLLYGALYLYAFWDPYGRMDHIPVALVNEDEPVEAADGSRVQAGQDLTDELIERRIFGWRTTDAADATEGLESGRYHLVFRIPADFSATVSSASDSGTTARQGQLQLISDDATNYLSGQLARTAFGEIRAAAAESASSRFFSAMLLGFTDLKTQTGEAADGAARIADGNAEASQGAGDLYDGSGRLVGGLGEAYRGADELADGLAELSSGTGRLAAGTARAADEVGRLAGRVNSAIDEYEPKLRENAGSIERGATLLADGADRLADRLDSIVGEADAIADRAERVQTRLDELLAAQPELAGDPLMIALRADVVDLAQRARTLVSTIDGADLDALRQRMREVSATARKVAELAPHLADDLLGARTMVNELSGGLDEIARGAARVDAGAGEAANGATALRGGIYRLSTGAQQIDGGLGELSAGLGELVDGANKLATGLADGADQIPGYDDADERAGILANPVGLDKSIRNAAATYGVAFSPYFLSLALWVGAMVIYMLLRPVNPRHTLGGGPAWRAALASWFPAVAIGAAQALLLYAVVAFGLGLDPVNPAATLGILTLTSITFVAIMQFLGIRLGPAGRMASLILLMLQLTSVGGTFPVETAPPVFQALHPFLPMTYVIDALRHSINGGPTQPIVTAVAVLLAFTAAALALSVLSVRGLRRLSPSKLHPELTL
ncbi:YhgE/Pip family protein [Melissospora conviva]|uniref:YhgE/Pip family protein n=1 Tax=Melissospora conviva TaxID=3388432 RepID=UPI003C1C6CD6